jgi:hypothetical protein
MLKKTAFAILFVFTFCIISSAQEDKGKRPSPPAQAQCKFSDGKTITVDYSSPRMRGRKIFGELVPYGEVWRTGANEATTFVTNEDLITVKGTNIPPGSYTIFTVPTSDTWTLIINKHTGEGGMPYKYESEELARGEIARNSVESWRLSTVIGYATFTSSATAFLESTLASAVSSAGISR